ncbi:MULTISPECIES: DUF2249 domain-containing protein [unclassified Rhizobacter]|uniref:DUF2249 domain-containing protein n=1 Tax=unclassified Rhizobacter TaxID=2640088 RepID=UPI0006FE0796|nr:MULTISPECIES: DUF2249 domain-containing protein [unclassified Rhizobacter]KQU67285.1 aminotransferase [Rhizobacter sp. Root29]KQW14570.1 aminotransferase [Rhizobacter sp. Root1238]KRB23925.1 aminotransferase [Rhizobacter sp. Root16D2]
MSPSQVSAPSLAVIDVRPIPRHERHALIFSTFRKLPVGRSMQLVNDHDPQPLQHQFHAEMPGAFSWEYVQAGPALWRVRITRQAVPDRHAAGGCCGGCGGAA